MGEAVKMWDILIKLWKKNDLDMDLWGNKVFTKGVPSKRKFARHVARVNPSTFQHYAHDDVAKRRKIGSKPGRRPKAKAWKIIRRRRETNRFMAEEERKEHAARREEELEGIRERLSRQERAYRLMKCNVQPYEESPSAWHEYEQQYWMKRLPLFCAVEGFDDVFLEREMECLNQCGKTFGLAEVFYVPPIGRETRKETHGRRKRMFRRIRTFRSMQTRRAMSMLDAGLGPGCRRLVVALDVLLEKYDYELECQGLERTDLREQLRERNYERQKKKKKMMRECRSGKFDIKRALEKNAEKQTEPIIDLDLSRKEKYSLFHQVGIEISQEEMAARGEAEEV